MVQKTETVVILLGVHYTVFNFASYLFLWYLWGRYYREIKSPQKFSTSFIANGTSLSNEKNNRHELTCYL